MSKEITPIAVIGMGCRFPGGADSPERLFLMAAEGRHGWTEVPSDRFNWSSFYHPNTESVSGTTNQKGGHFLNQSLAAFDAGFFGIPPREAEAIDPQQRVVLEASWEAVENAGIPMDKLKGSDTAVFVAMFGHDYEHAILKDPMLSTKYHNTGAARPLLANRVSYVFDLHGPSVTIDTGCSGSLVAVNLACQSLRSGESEMALAGGVALMFSPDQLSLMTPTGIFNDEGRCFSFDHRGKGYGRGEGVGVVLMKRLDDAIRDGDNIRAIIRNSAANQDGRTNGITLPNQLAQERLARKVFRGLSFSPTDVDYVEAHGTGTKAGDVAEIKAISNVFGEGRVKSLFVGTAKPNIGHSESASGAAGLIKTIIGMEKGLIHPQLLLEELKPDLKSIIGRVNIAQSLQPWTSKATRLAAVNSFGSGGTNAMVVLEEYQRGSAHGTNGTTSNGRTSTEKQNGLSNRVNHTTAQVHGKTGRARLFPLSARSEHSLLHGIEDLKCYLERNEQVDVDDLSYTLTSRRSKFQWRYSTVAQNVPSLIEELGTESKFVKIPTQVSNIFVFTGQEAQYFQMGITLLRTESDFTRSILRSDAILKQLGATWNLVDELCKDETSTRLNDSKFGQPASTAIQVALVDLLKSWGVLPSAAIGHSSGEISAAYATGAITHDAAIRIAYERSFLADAAKKHVPEAGAMMAVGAGEVDTLAHIKNLSSSGTVVVACVNSPSSTTVSGDAAGIEELQKILQAQDIFARRLKVDTAYHSHHMKAVSQEYMDRLTGLKFEPPSIRFFSTVSGEEKHEGFGASYWVENLVSQVRFLKAIECLGREMGQGPFNFIEVGPHKALAGPIRQSLASLQGEGLSYRYIPTLVRDQDGITSLMSTGSSLFVSGSDIDLAVVASLGISTSAKVLGSLPHYHWNHTVDYWREPRLSKDYRCRPHPHHDLLGIRQLTSPDSEPSWRIILTSDGWIRDHVVDGFSVYPGSGYMAMAIEAIKQIHPNMTPKTYHLRNVSFKRTLSVPSDSATGVEVMLTLSRSKAATGYDFQVSSIQDGKWQEHCDGHISAEFESTTDEVDQDREADFNVKAQIERLENARSSCKQLIRHEALYAELSSLGNQYGPSFAAVEEVRLGPSSNSLSKVIVPDIAARMPSRFMQPHVIHPSTLDAVLHACVVLFQREVLNHGSTMPVFIGHTAISADIVNHSGAELEIMSELRNTFTQSSEFDIVAIHDNHPVINITDGELRIVGATSSDDTQLDTPSGNIFKMEWGLDISSLTAADLESVVIPLQSHEAGITPAEKVTLLHSASVRYMQWAVEKIRRGGLKVQTDYRTACFAWMTSLIDSDAGQKMLERIPDSEAEVVKQLARVGVEGEIVTKLGTNLTQVLVGDVDPLAIMLEDDLISRIYKGDEIERANQYMAEYVHRLSFQRKDIRILEIGAGTGSATLPLFQRCSPNGEAFASEYVYTDVSGGFFEKALASLKDWEPLLTFKTLDLEKDPIDQGFDEYGYDLILASNVVHATHSLNKSLGHIHRLLKPGGIIGMVEVVKPQKPFHNMTFGLLPGWWAGTTEGRTSSPLQSVEEWRHRLLDASFSGVDLVAYDFPEPAAQCAFLTSTSIPTSKANGRHAQRIEILNAIPEGYPDQLCATPLLENLTRKGFDPSVRSWADDSIDQSVSYVVLDSASRPLLAHASSEQWKHVISLVLNCSKLYWVMFADGSNGLVPDFSLVAGFARSALSEVDGLDFFTLNVQDPLDSQGRVLSRVSDLIASTETKAASNQALELEYMLKDGRLHIQRLVSNPTLGKAFSSTSEPEREDCLFHQDTRPLKVQIEKPGLLSSLTFVDDVLGLGELGPDEVEVQPYAYGVNFKDVFVALGQMKATQTMCGECAGVVTRVGSNFTSQYRVGERVAMISGTPYASLARTHGCLIHPIPESMPFSDATTIPVAFSTAFYGLVDCANLKPGQTVLIHAASGGLGQAAVQIAQHIGATIFATVGSEAKRRLLVEKYGIPETHIFSSRTLSFQAGIMRLTGGQGVDVVLNSLSGDALRASWRSVAKMGCFVEVGKTDIYQRSQLDMEVFDRNVRFASVDLIVLSKCRPAAAKGILERVFTHFETGHYSPLPVTLLPISSIEQAFRLIQARKHTGKIVLEAGLDSTVSAKMRPFRLRSDATYVVVGGLGNIGRRLTAHLQTCGASHVVILSRRHLEPKAREELEAESTEGSDKIVKVMTCDILVAEDVLRVAKTLHKDFPPVRGVIVAAMVLADRTLSQMELESFQTALRPKYDGTKNVAAGFAGADLDFFINLSSVSSIIGLRGQTNYSAGNAYQDAFVQSQVSKGVKNYVSLNLPLISETEAKTQEVQGFVTRQGCQMLPVSSILPLVDYAMSRAGKDGCNQIALGLSAETMATRAENGVRITPLLSHIFAQSRQASSAEHALKSGASS
ncbi:hypothetical protein GGR53DRAFT_509864 [Hypoxylon sp. FL1150]|nr:hypothetical protein GGR53DRAFT_509864 [Hypoxylon sp. FL1150]